MLYAYATGERSSPEDRAPLPRGHRLPGDQGKSGAPDHSTIARFRARHAEAARRALRPDPRPLRQGAGWSRSAGSPSTAPGSSPTPPIPPTAPIGQLAREILEEAARVDEDEDALFGDRRGDRAAAGARPTRASAASACARQSGAWTRSTGEGGRDGGLGAGQGRIHRPHGLKAEGRPDKAAADPAEGAAADQPHRPRLAPGEDALAASSRATPPRR